MYCDYLDFTCTQFWYTYPAQDSSIFMPVPPAIRGFLPSGLNQNSQLGEIPLNNTFSIAILLAYSKGGIVTTLFDRDALPNVTMHFNGVITNKDGEGIYGGFKAEFMEIGCDYQHFQQISEEQDKLIDLIDNITSADQLNALRYQIGKIFKLKVFNSVDLLKFKDGWNGCAQLLSQLLTSSTIIQKVNSTDCVAIPGKTICIILLNIQRHT